jgi:ubiquinone/menaquinone biosynthesis C-methylase UbiE
MAAASGLDSYIIRGGKEGRARLSVLARLMAPTTGELLDGLGSMRGLTVVDVGCGGVDVTFDLARRAGLEGRIHGLDLDGEKVASARNEAKEQGFANVVFHEANVMERWPVGGADVVYARFIFTHVTDPVGLARRAIEALKPGGLLVVEDKISTGFSATRPVTPSSAFASYTPPRHRSGAPIP